MKLIQKEFSLLLAVVGAGTGVVYHDALHAGTALGAVIGAGMGLIAANLLTLLIIVGFNLVADKPCLEPALPHDE